MKSISIALMTSCLLSTAHAFHLPKHETKSYECTVCTRLSRDNLHDKWQLSPTDLWKPVSNLQTSRGYTKMISGAELRRGILINTTAPGAVIRIIPVNQKTLPSLDLKTPTNNQLSLKDASSLYSKETMFGDSKLPIGDQALMQIKPELGAGSFVLSTKDKLLTNDDKYSLHVFDKYSLTYLEVETDKLNYLYGDTLTATIKLREGEIGKSIDNLAVYLVSPDDEYTELEVEQIDNNTYTATTKLTSEHAYQGKNWYIETTVSNGIEEPEIRRSGHAAFSYAIPSASFISIKKLSSEPLIFVATLDVATASRYAVQAVLFQQNLKGKPQPIQTTQSARWLEPGQHAIQFSFDNPQHLYDDQLFLGYLRLIDYGQLKSVYQFDNPIKVTKLGK